MASKSSKSSRGADSMALRQSIETSPEHASNLVKPSKATGAPARMETSSSPDFLESGEPPSHDNCDATHDMASTITITSTNKTAEHTVAPFLAKHIPVQYAPLGQALGQVVDKSRAEPSSKFCYRHRPDLKCRRTADEPSMENLQRVRVLRPSHTAILC